jgi:hypothetical protein
MEQFLGFFRTYEIWIYAVLGLGAALYLRKFLLAWHELRGAAFGLERNNAQSRLNQSASLLVLLITMAVSEFVLVSFIVPSFPGAIPLLTPTLDVLASPTTTLPAATLQPGGETLDTPAPPPTNQAEADGCITGQVEISTPKEGDEVRGLVEVIGSVNIENFGFYKLESKRPDELVWTILLAGNQPVQANVLGVWDTRRLPPGEYQLSVVPVNNEANTLARCMVNVRVALPLAETEQP